MPEPDERECCATTTDCYHLDDCAERPAAEFLGRFQDGGGAAPTSESGYTSSDGLMRSADPRAVALWEDITARAEFAEMSWTEILRARGVKLAHPDDGWVKREQSRFHLSWYPQFDDRPEVGDLIAFGKAPDREHYQSWHDVWRGRTDQYAREQMERLTGRPESAASGYRICRVVSVTRRPTILAHGLNTDIEYVDTGERMPPRKPTRWQWVRERLGVRKPPGGGLA